MLTPVRRFARFVLPNAKVSQTLLFVHVPKAAGSTVRETLNRTFGARRIFVADSDTAAAISEWQALTPSQRRRTRLIVGHMPVLMHNFVEGPFRYFTVLRHPVDRLVSHYYFVRSNRNHYLHEIVHRQRLSLEEYCLSDLTVEFDNDQVRLISGLRSSVPINGINQTHLRQAIDNIERMFSVVGVQDDIAGFFEEFERSHHVRMRRGPSRNVTRSRPKLAEVPDEVRQKILARSKWDMALYEYAKARRSGHSSGPSDVGLRKAA